MRKSTALGIVGLLLTSILIVTPQPTRADSAQWGYFASRSGGTFDVPANSTFYINGFGEGHNISIYVLTIDEFWKASANESFSYMAEYSRVNVSSAEINGTLPEGTYGYIVDNLEDGYYHVTGPNIFAKPYSQHILSYSKIAENGTYELFVNGTGQFFDLYVVTEENALKAMNNESFAYIGEWSVLNITQADINMTLSAGDLYVLIDSHGEGPITIDGPIHKVATDSNGFELPMELIVIVSVAVVLIACVYILMRRRMGRDGD